MKWLAFIFAVFFIAVCDKTGDTPSDNDISSENDISPDSDNLLCRTGDTRCGYLATKGTVIVVCSENGWEYVSSCDMAIYGWDCYDHWDDINGKYDAQCLQNTTPEGPECKENDTLCTWKTVVSICVNGTLEKLKECKTDGTEICSETYKDGVYSATCQERICSKGESVCRTDGIYVCNDLGEWVLKGDCPPNQVCYDHQDDEGRWYAHCEGVDEKPNIYLYPTVPLTVTVRIGFPQGGHVTVSEPLYDDGWTVRVTPDGLIDGQWRFLFYESVQPSGWQKKRGYLVPTDEMEQFFRSDLAARGFAGQEIEDFIEWWIPRLAGPRYLIVYPQDDTVISTLETLELSIAPDSILRHRYLIETTNEPVTILPPEAPAPFVRDGFTVTEWGVIRI